MSRYDLSTAPSWATPRRTKVTRRLPANGVDSSSGSGDSIDTADYKGLGDLGEEPRGAPRTWLRRGNMVCKSGTAHKPQKWCKRLLVSNPRSPRSARSPRRCPGFEERRGNAPSLTRHRTHNSKVAAPPREPQNLTACARPNKNRRRWGGPAGLLAKSLARARACKARRAPAPYPLRYG